MQNGLFDIIVDVNGKIYITDDKFIVPTELQLNFINKNKKTIPPEEFVGNIIVTRD